MSAEALTLSSPAARLNLIGGDLALDFVNTVGGLREPGRSSEYLSSYGDLVAWSWHAGIVSDAQAQALLEHARAHPRQAETVWAQAIRLREALYRLFAAHAHNKLAPRADLEWLNEFLAGHSARRQLVARESGYAWSWKKAPQQLDWMLWLIADAAAALLTSPRLALVRQCSGEECTWLFVDTSKNHRRRWCDMRDCGNRAKARRHYERVRQNR